MGIAPKTVMLISRVNYSVPIKYGKESLVLPPKGRTAKDLVKDKLGQIDPRKILVV